MACAADSALALPGLAQDAVVGLASHYGSRLHGRKTASGERLDRMEFTAASNRFPLGSTVLVRRPSNDACAIVRVNDRMSRRHRVRVIDVTHEVGRHLGMLQAGVVRVEVSLLSADWLPVVGPVECADVLAGPPRNCPDCISSDAAGLAGQPADVANHPAQIPALQPATEVSSP